MLLENLDRRGCSQFGISSRYMFGPVDEFPRGSTNTTMLELGPQNHNTVDDILPANSYSALEGTLP